MLNALAVRMADLDARGRPLDAIGRFEDSRGRPRDPVAEAMSEGRIVKADEPLTFVRGDGERFRVDGSAAPIRAASGEVSGSVLVLHDVSERVRLEEELREAQKLDAIGRLAGGVAHDFNNQLTSILGYAELLVWSFDEGDPRRQDMDEIRKAADRAALVTQQLLAFSRRQILQPRLVHVPDVVTRSARLLHRILPSHVTLDTIVESAIEPVHVDPHQLGHVLLNLAVSSRDAMPEGGAITIRVSNVAVQGAPAARGLPAGPLGAARRAGHRRRHSGRTAAARLRALRQPDRRSRPAASSSPSSTASSRRAAGAFTSRASRGAAPASCCTSPPWRWSRCRWPMRRPRAATRRVLLVEDDEAVRALLVSTLERQGYRVIATSTSAAAMAALSHPLHALDRRPSGLREGAARRWRRAIARRAAGPGDGRTSRAAATTDRVDAPARPDSAEALHATRSAGGVTRGARRGPTGHAPVAQRS